MHRLRLASRARGCDATAGKLLAERLGDLRASAVARAQEEHSSDLRRVPALGLRDRRRDEPGMQRRACRRQELATPVEVERVVRVTAVGRAAARRHEATVAQPAQVIRDKALPLPRELAQLADAPVAACQIAQQLPPQRVARKLEKTWWPGCDGAHRP